MRLEDYLNSTENKRRILVVSDISRGHDLMRKHEAMTGALIHNVTCMTITQLIDAVNLYIQSENGFELQNTVIDPTEALMLFRSIVFKNIKSLKFFNNEKMMDLVTTREIFSKANLVRSNGWTGKEPKSGNERVSDLKLLISEYEKRLEEEKILDGIALLKMVIAQMKKWANPDAELKNIFCAEIAYLKEDMDQLSGIQREFLLLVQNNQDLPVELYEVIPSLEMLDNCASKAEFFRGYGSYNEVSFVANDILSKKIPFGSVTVLYTSNAQLAPITAALQGNGLAANIVSDYSAEGNAYVSLTRKIIAWANDDFSEKALEKIFACSVIRVEADDETGNKVNVLASQKYYNHVLKAKEDNVILGWGYNRNIEFINHRTEAATTDSEKSVLKLHRELIDIFGKNGKQYDEKNKVQPSEVYKKLVRFVENNTVTGEEYAAGMDAIKRLSGAVNFEDRSLPLNEIIIFVDELLATASVKDSESPDAISVQKFSGDWVLLSRPNVYIIGLSLKDMQGSTTESPVLSDDEMEKYLGIGYKPTIKAVTELSEKNLYRTLKTFNGEGITFGFSSYDTVSFCANNPSSFFREALHKFKGTEIGDLPEFVYGNPTNPIDIPLPTGLKDKTVYDVHSTTSNSSMEVLLDCPKKYYYSKLRKVPENTYIECDYSRWLDARLKGSFFHEIAEKYVNQMLIKPASEGYAVTADEVLIRSIAEKIMDKMLIEMPVAFEGLAIRETENLIEAAVAYFNRLHNILGTSGWRPLFTEFRFDQATYKVEDYESNPYEFAFTGIIDRIDYLTDHSANKILLRIVDYKTGKKASKRKEDDLGKLLQYTVYENALMKTGHHTDEKGTDKMLLDAVKKKISELESVENIDEWDIEFESFNYAFPMENKDFEPIKIEAAKIEGINLTRLKCILTALQDKKTYPDHLELYEIVKEYALKYSAKDAEISNLSFNMTHTDKSGNVTGISDDEINHCKYCEYGDVCIHRKAGEIK